jgi:hypothetical protein
LKIKLKGRHFGIAEVMEAEWQAVLYTASRRHLINGRGVGGGSYSWNETTSRAMVASSPKLVSHQMAAPVPEIMIYYLVPYGEICALK